MTPKIEAAPTNEARAATKTSIGADAHSLADIGLAVLGHAMHMDTAQSLPAADVFPPGGQRDLAAVLHRMASENKPLDALAVRLELERLGAARPTWDTLVSAVSAGALVVRQQATYYAAQLVWDATAQKVTGALRRVVQLLNSGPAATSEATAELRHALGLLAGESQ